MEPDESIEINKTRQHKIVYHHYNFMMFVKF